MKLAILGSGAWGSALALAFARHHAVSLWGRDAAQMAELAAERVNRRYLPDCPFPDSITLTAELPRAIQGAELILIVTPIAGLRPTLRALTALSSELPPILWACKGFEAGSSLLPHQVVAEELPVDHPCGVLSGPSFAREWLKACPLPLPLQRTMASLPAVSPRTAQPLAAPVCQ
jgi:glycerol-3-phosphate dehydrogenase (NAD(P)+)